MGVFDGALCQTIATVLGRLGSKRAMVVHAADGLDEISTTSETTISEFRDGKVETFVVTPEDLGVPRATLDDLRIDSATK